MWWHETYITAALRSVEIDAINRQHEAKFSRVLICPLIVKSARKAEMSATSRGKNVILITRLFLLLNFGGMLVTYFVG